MLLYYRLLSNTYNWQHPRRALLFEVEVKSHSVSKASYSLLRMILQLARNIVSSLLLCVHAITNPFFPLSSYLFIHSTLGILNSSRVVLSTTLYIILYSTAIQFTTVMQIAYFHFVC